jgi:hypothetical protein
MTYELLYLRQIIDSTLHGMASETLDIDKLEATIKEESLRLLCVIQQNISSLKPGKGRIYLIQRQKELSLMLDELEKMVTAPPTSLSTQKKASLQNICKLAIDHLITELERYFPFYFDYQEFIPLHRLNIFQEELNCWITEFSRTLESSGATDDVLGNFFSILEQLHNDNKNITYQRVIYLNIFFEKLNTALTYSGIPPETLDIILTAISLNFNHPAFYHFACGYFSGEVEKCENITTQYRTLNLLKKTLQQVFKILPSHYNQNIPPIDESLRRYIEAELDYLKSTELIAEELNSGGLLDANFKVTLTVRQLAIFIRLQVESEIIISQSPKALRQYVTKHYSTLEKENFSEKSFKNAYYNNTGKDIEKVIEKIAIMLAIAQEKY